MTLIPVKLIIFYKQKVVKNVNADFLFDYLNLKFKKKLHKCKLKKFFDYNNNKTLTSLQNSTFLQLSLQFAKKNSLESKGLQTNYLNLRVILSKKKNLLFSSNF